MRYVKYSCLTILSVFFISCSSGLGGSEDLSRSSAGKTTVTLNVGQQSSSYFGAPQAVPADVMSMNCRASGSGMSTMDMPVDMATGIATMEVPNGSNRHFEVFAYGAGGELLYYGEAYAVLDGTPVTLSILMQAVGGSSSGGWARTYGGSFNDYSISGAYQTSDGGYIVSALTESFGAGDRDIWVLKLDSEGMITWQETYGDSDIDEVTSIRQTSDGGYIVGGNHRDPGADADAWILKLDGSGNVVWQKTYGAGSNEFVQALEQTSDGGYIASVRTISFGAGASDIWLIKLDSSGDIVWQKTFGGVNDEYAYGLQQTSDGGYVAAGLTDTFGAGLDDVWVIKVDSFGNIMWQKTYGGADNDDARSIRQTSDGGYIVAGQTSSFGAGNEDFWVLRLDSSGNVIWQKAFGGTLEEYAFGIEDTSDGGSVVSGRTYSFGAGSIDIWLIKLDSAGNIIWQKTYGDTGGEDTYSARQTSDGGYIVAGLTNSYGAGGADLWILKTGSDGTLGCGLDSDSSVVPQDTAVTGQDTSVTGQNTAITGQDTFMSSQDSGAVTTTQCFTGGGIQGTWNTHSGISGDQPFGEWPGWEHGQGTIDAGGTLTFTDFLCSDGDNTLPSSLTVNVAPDNTVTVTEEPPYHGTINAGQDLIVGTNYHGDGGYELSVAQKAGSNFALIDIQGSWRMHAISTGDGFQVARWTHADAAFDAVGNLDFTNIENSFGSQGPQSAMVSLSPDGILTVPASPSGHGTVSPGRDLIVMTDSDTGSTNLGILQRAGSGFVQADLAGTWSFHSVVSGDDPQWRGWERGVANIDDVGNLTITSFLDSDGSTTDYVNTTFTLAADGIITMTSGGPLHAAMSQGRDLVVGTVDDDDGGYKFFVMQKTSDDFIPGLAVRIQMR